MQELQGFTYEEARRRARIVLWDRGSDYAEPYHGPETITEGMSLSQVPMRSVLTVEDKEDILQDALLQWLRKQDQHLSRCQELGVKPLTWFGSIVRHTAMRRLETVEQARTAPAVVTGHADWGTTDDATVRVRWELSEDTCRRLGALAPTAQAIVDGYTQQEIARQLGVSQPAVAKRVRRIRQVMAHR